MSGGGMKPETIVRKRLERAELGRDACRMKRCGHSYRKIGEQLGCSHEQAHVLVQEGINAYLNEAKQESKEWLDAIIAEHIKIAQEAWIQWERSKQDRERTTSKTTPEGAIEVTEMVEGQCGDPRQLAIVQSSMDSIAKLRKLGDIEQGRPKGASDVDPQGAISDAERLQEQIRQMYSSILPPSVVGRLVGESMKGREVSENNGQPNES